MENAVARVRFEGVEDEEEGAREGELSDGDEQEWKLARQLVAQQNRKGKKSGGFQSMGEETSTLFSWDICGFRSL